MKKTLKFYHLLYLHPPCLFQLSLTAGDHSGPRVHSRAGVPRQAPPAGAAPHRRAAPFPLARATADARWLVRARDRGGLHTSSRGGRRRPPLASSQRRPWRCASPPAGSATPAPPARPLLGRPIHPNSLRGEARSRGGRRASSRAEPRHGRSSAFGCDRDEASRAPPWRRAFGCACRAEELSRRPEAHAPASARAGAVGSVGRAGGRTWVAHGLAAAAAPLLRLELASPRPPPSCSARQRLSLPPPPAASPLAPHASASSCLLRQRLPPLRRRAGPRACFPAPCTPASVPPRWISRRRPPPLLSLLLRRAGSAGAGLREAGGGLLGPGRGGPARWGPGCSALLERPAPSVAPPHWLRWRSLARAVVPRLVFLDPARAPSFGVRGSQGGAEGAASQGRRAAKVANSRWGRRARSPRAPGAAATSFRGRRRPWRPRAPVEGEEAGGDGELHPLAEEAEEAWGERKRQNGREG